MYTHMMYIIHVYYTCILCMYIIHVAFIFVSPSGRARRPPAAPRSPQKQKSGPQMSPSSPSGRAGSPQRPSHTPLWHQESIEED